MLNHRETRIETVVAVKASEVLPPGGRCRELMIQLDIHHSGEEIELADAGRTRYRAGPDAPWFRAEVDFANPVRRRAFGVDLPVMPVKDLLRYKRRLGRAVDREDVAHLTSPPGPTESGES